MLPECPHRTPADIRHRIVERLKDISCETKKLKDLRNNNFDASTLPPIFSNAEMVSKACQTENTKSASSLVIESLPSVVNDDLIENVQSDDANCQPNAEKNTTDASVASCSMHSLDLLQANDTREVSTMEIAVCQADVQYHKLDGNEDEAVSVSSINPSSNVNFEKLHTTNMTFRINDFLFCPFAGTR